MRIFKYAYVLCNNYAQRTREFLRNREIEKETRETQKERQIKGFGIIGHLVVVMLLITVFLHI